MKSQLVALILISIFALNTEAAVKTSSKKSSLKNKVSQSTKKSTVKSKLSTEVDFDGSTLHGRYQKSAETLATVENDKAMMDLLGNRKNFKDRLAKSGSVR